MKPKNFPARKNARRQRALNRGWDGSAAKRKGIVGANIFEIESNTEDNIISNARSIRTKKAR